MTFSESYEKYKQLRLLKGLKASSLQRELEQHRHFWKYLEDLGFKGDALMVNKKIMKEYAYAINCCSFLSNNAKRSRLSRLKGFYQEALLQGWILDNPTTHIQLPREEKNPIKTLSIKQMKSLLEAPSLHTIIGLRDRTMMELMYSSGLRRAELLQVKRGDVGEDFRTLNVIGKGDKECVLPVGKMAAHFLKFYIAEVWPKLNVNGHETLFLSTRSGEPIDEHSFYNLIRAYSDKLGFPEPVGPHVFRYSVCTHLADMGADIRLIQEFMRHEKISTTARYIKQSLRTLQEAHKATHPRG